ncbi:hypothetical protein [Saccharopolyspora spinosa]|uniref:Uncharacterized protein n=1 Tax=Saccharopolyspora spinosa TaxID=60894 RepID=A0A2N3Y8I2_SACSN|nr:hypothetical protein [Saccharopolyspora spinosa]PKW19244.1 hypothetical protein A8926_7407 [Saccharopolyspora spinosa]
MTDMELFGWLFGTREIPGKAQAEFDHPKVYDTDRVRTHRDELYQLVRDARRPRRSG